MNSRDIEFRDSDYERPPTSARLSPAGKAIGLRRRGAVGLLVREPVLEEILEYSERDLQREQAGFLLGLHGQASGRVGRVELRAFLPARYTRCRASSVTFTYETWTRLRSEMEQRHPDLELVGWHHTHPGMGVFLSDFDRFIHRHFFAQPWQFAMVVDPRQKHFGFFQWAEGRLAGSGFAWAEETHPSA